MVSAVLLWWIVSILICSGLAFGSFRLYAWWIDPNEKQQSNTRMRRVLLGGEAMFCVLTIVVLRSMGTTNETHAVLSSLGVPMGLGTLALVPTVLGFSVVVTVGYLGFLPVAREYRDAETSTFRAAIIVFRWTLAFGGFLGILYALLMFAVESKHPLVSPVGMAVVIIASYTASPWIVRLSQSTRPLTETERKRFERLNDGLDVHRIHVLSGRDNRIATAFVRGYPPQLFVTDHLFEAYDDQHVSVVLAAVGGRLRQRYLEYKFGGLLVLGTVAVGLLTASGSVLIVGCGVLVVAAAAFVWYGNRLVYRVDENVADRLGRERVITTYERLADAHGTEGRRSWLRTLQMNPPLPRRIARLRNRANSMD